MGAVGTSALLRNVMATTVMLASTATTAIVSAPMMSPRPLLEAFGTSRASCIGGGAFIAGGAG
jgi:hypothetical protein